MTSSLNDSVADVVQALKSRGFLSPQRTDEGWVTLRGALNAGGNAHPCFFSFDTNFIELPRVRLLEVPESLKPVAEHINSTGSLCYIAHGTIALNIFDPVGQTLACLERAEYVLGKILAGELVDDLEDEFFAYWNNGTFCVYDIGQENASNLQAFDIGIPGNVSTMLTDNVARTKKKLELSGVRFNLSEIPVYRINTKVRPRPRTDAWPPEEVKDILTWQGRLDTECKKKIEKKVLEAAKTSASIALFIIESPDFTYAFSVTLSSPDERKRKRLPTDKTTIYPLKVTPQQIVRIDNKYITKRNIPNKLTLADKKIAVIGCGTIGGYLTELLTKMGAGSGKGELVLVDNDILWPQNIGRHRLGVASLFQNKATALLIEMHVLMPGMNILARAHKVQDVDLRGMDLVIDATGEEAVGHWLTLKLPADKPLLTVWIEGNGAAVRALLRPQEGCACYRCIAEYENRGEMKSTEEPLNPVLAGQGCESLYVPFPAFVSSNAANLGAEMVLDWVNGETDKLFRTRITNSKFTLKTPDCSPSIHSECPICIT
ncbi:thiamine biosynthesis protein ThiF [compost metagenome]